MTHSARSVMLVWTLSAKRRRPKMALERISPPFWIGYWRETDLHSPSVLRRISPVPLQTQSPVPLSPCCAEPKPAATDEPQHGATVLRITVEPELLITSDQVREPATTPATRERAVESESAERSSAHCAMAEGDLNANLGLLDSEGGVLDVYVDLPPLLPPSSEPSVTPVSPSSPERDSVPKLRQGRAPVSPSSPERDSVPESSPPGDSLPSPMITVAISLTSNQKRRMMRKRAPEQSRERAPVPEFSTERAPVSSSSPEWAPVPEIGPDRASVPKIGPERASVPEFSPERAPVPESSPERARVPESNTERASVPKFGPGKASDPVYSPESPEAQKCPPTLPLMAPPAPPWSVIDHPSPRDSTSLAAPCPSIPPAPSGPVNGLLKTVVCDIPSPPRSLLLSVAIVTPRYIWLSI